MISWLQQRDGWNLSQRLRFVVVFHRCAEYSVLNGDRMHQGVSEFIADSVISRGAEVCNEFRHPLMELLCMNNLLGSVPVK